MVVLFRSGWGQKKESVRAVLTTEAFAVALLENHSDSKLVVKAIIQNYDNVIKLITE